MCEQGKTIIAKIDGESIEVDSCIADIVIALNQGGIKTIECCCGHNKQHGTIFLEDGRELEILNSLVVTSPYREPIIEVGDNSLVQHEKCSECGCDVIACTRCGKRSE